MTIKKESRNILKKREVRLNEELTKERVRALKKYKKPPKIRKLDIEGLPPKDIEEIVETRYAN